MDNDQAPYRRPKWEAILLAVALASAVGALPWVLVVGRPTLVLLPPAIGVLITLTHLRKESLSWGYRPALLEYLVGGVGLMIQPAAASMLCIVIYVAVQWVTHGANLLCVRWGWAFRFPETPAALVISLVLFLMMLLGLTPWIINFVRQLYPKGAGVPSAFYDLVRGGQRRQLLWALVGLAALLVLETFLLIRFPAFATSPGWNWGLAMLLLMISSPVATLGEGVVSEGRGSQVDSIASILEAAGYEVTPSPRTGREDLDPLLGPVDLYAASEPGRYAIQVRRPGRDRDALLQVADELATAAWALDENRGDPPPPPPTCPLLVLVGSDKEGLGDLVGRRSNTQAVSITDPSVLKSSEDNGAQLADLATSLLGLPIATASSPASTPEDPAPVADAPAPEPDSADSG